MTDKQNQVENDAAGCARLHGVAFTLSGRHGTAIDRSPNLWARVDAAAAEAADRATGPAARNTAELLRPLSMLNERGFPRFAGRTYSLGH